MRKLDMMLAFKDLKELKERIIFGLLRKEARP